ncbi:MAG: AAA family ATPase [Anaerolineales bacterium]|nr:AAA family ATPase [Anaerolineales bacterium]
MLSIDLLGPPRLQRDGETLRLARRKSRALVYFLAAHSEPVTREQLLSVLWPDLDRPAAQQTLRTTLHGLRKLLGPALLADDGRLALAPETRVDVRAFEAHLRGPRPGPDQLRAGLALYRGDFLEGFSLAGTPSFDDWAALERERCRRLAVRGLAILAAIQEARGDFAGALETVDRALAFDALQEDLQRMALRLHYLAGDRAGAIRRYAQLRQLLDDEMGVLPMGETRALYDAILTDSLPRPAAPAGPLPEASRPAVAGPAAAAPPAPFVGRADELARLGAQLEPHTPRSARRLVVIEGEPGIGKTRLAQEFLLASGTLALRGSARDLEQALPYQPIIEALRHLLAHPAWPALQAGLSASGLAPVWLAEIGRLLPELSAGQAPPGSAPDEPRLWEAVHQFLAAIARQRPAAVFIDDAQWADASTLGLLNYLHRRAQADEADLLYLVAARPAASDTALAALLTNLVREDRLARLSLSRLGPTEVSALAQQWTAARAPGVRQADEVRALAEWLLSASEGSPYVLVALLRHASEHGLLNPAGGLELSALGEGPVLPQTVYSLIQSRLARLSDGARRVLDAGVAAGREFAFEVVYRAAGLSESAALDALDELRAAGLIDAAAAPGGAEVGRSLDLPQLTYLTFDHSLTMEVAYREVGEPRHRRLHRRVAEALEQVYGRQRLDAVAGVVAWHFAEGNELERAAPYARRAGQLAARLAAWTEAAAFFEQALQATESARQRLDLAQQLGEVYLNAGDANRASEVLRLALTLARDEGDDAQVEAVQLLMAQVQLYQARYGEVRGLARQVLAGTASADRAATAEFLIGTADSLEGADLASASQHLRAALERLREAAARGEADPGRRARVVFELGGVAAQLGDLPAAVAQYREAIEIADYSGYPGAQPYRILARNNLAYHLHLLSPGDPDARAQAEAGLQLAQAQGQFPLMSYLHSTLGEIALARGDPQAAERHFNEGLALARRLAMPERVAGLTANLGLVALARGESTLALYRLSAAMAQADAVGTRHLAAQIRLWLAPLLPAAEARERLAEVRAFAESGGRVRLLAEVEAMAARLGEAG